MLIRTLRDAEEAQSYGGFSSHIRGKGQVLLSTIATLYKIGFVTLAAFWSL